MNKPQPRVRRVFDKTERTIGGPLERLVSSYKFVDVMAVGMNAKRAVTGTAGRVVGKVLHKVNIATRDDVQRLNKSLSTLASEVRSNNAASTSPSTGRRPPVKASAATRPSKATKTTKTAKAAKAAKAVKATKATSPDGTSG